MKSIVVAAALAFFQFSGAQDLKGLKSITVGSDIELKLVKGSENKLEHDGEIEVEFNNGDLDISGEGSATLYYKNELESMTVGSDAHVSGNDEIKGKSFQLTAGSDSEIALNLSVQKLQVVAGSDSQVALSGKAGSMTATIGSDGEFSSERLDATDVTINLGSDAEGVIKASGSVNATAGSDSSMVIHGNPKNVNEVKGSDAEITIVR